jgi:predicted extracellular nuclease
VNREDRVFHFRLRLAVVVAALAALAGAGNALAASPNLVISQVYGGGGNSGAPFTHDYIEIFNRGATTVPLAGYSLQYASATGTGNLGASPTQLTELPGGALAPGQRWLVQQASQAAVGAALPEPDLIDPTPIAMAAGAGKVALVRADAAGEASTLGCNGGSTACSAEQLARIVDLVGYGGANFFETAPAPAASNTQAVFRADLGCTDTDNNASDFTAAAPSPRNSQTTLHFCNAESAPAVSSTVPAAGAGGVAPGANIGITFNEAVDVAGSWFTISCTGSALHTAAVSGGPTSFTLDPDTDFTGSESCTVTIIAANVTDEDELDPPDAMAENHVFTFQIADVFACGNPATRIHEIQGTGAAAAQTGLRTIEGVVVGDYQQPGGFSGYYVQEEAADQDTNPLSSEGIFVFSGSSGTAVDVSVGQLVRVRGTASEFSGQTQISATGSTAQVAVCPVTVSMPPAASVSLPVFAIPDLERYEGMRVNFAQTLTVAEVFNLGRFGEVSLSGIGRLYSPTAVALPGADAQAKAADNNRSRIILDDGDNRQNIDPTIYPFGGLSATNTLRVGYTLPSLTGIMDFRFNAYRIQPVGIVDFTASNRRTAAPEPVGGNLKIASFNVLNYFNGDGLGGGFPTARGAEDAEEFTRQRTKIISALRTINADVVGVMELENDASPNSALGDLVSGLNDAMGAGTYSFIDTGIIGTDQIKVGILYKQARVHPIGDWEIITSAVDARFIDTRSRPAIAQTFQHAGSGQKLTVVVNHLKSKSSACLPDDPDTGDGSGNCNGTRTLAAEALIDWIAGDPTGSGDPDVLVMGDLNAYTFETPIRRFVDAGYVNLIRQFHDLEAYSYVFNGESGYLDHALATPSLAPQVSGVTDWHINPDEPTVLDYNRNFKTANQFVTFYDPGPYRSSDHDPVVIGVDLELTYDSLCALTRTYSSKTDVADSLCEMLAAAESAAARGTHRDLRNYVNLVTAQTGKAFTAGEAATLIDLAESL